MFSHVVLGARDLGVSRAFYDAVLGALGYGEPVQDRSTRWIWPGPTGNFVVTEPIDGEPATYGNGSTIGFACQSPEQVEAWHAAGVANGGEAIEEAPGIRQMGPNAYYLAYLRDPAGNKLCAMHAMAPQH